VILTEPDLVRWGRLVGSTVATPVFLALRGELGAGKSVLARAVARGAGVEGAVPSPTFNLVFRYRTPGGTEVVHLDLYRLESPDELWELGWEELGAGDEIVLVEWPERAGDHLPADRWEIELERAPGGSGVREVRVRKVGGPPHLPGFPIALSGGGRGR
jgi:tRNA threonylcarbamoyladenosine biosynthesis protein TsaE